MFKRAGTSVRVNDLVSKCVEVRRSVSKCVFRQTFYNVREYMLFNSKNSLYNFALSFFSFSDDDLSEMMRSNGTLLDLQTR